MSQIKGPEFKSHQGPLWILEQETHHNQYWLAPGTELYEEHLLEEKKVNEQTDKTEKKQFTI